MVRNERGGHTRRIDTVDGTAIYRDERHETYYARIPFDQRDPVLTVLLSLVARTTDRDRLELAPLTDVVDPDALERFVAHWADSGTDDEPVARLSFTYEGCDVTISASGEIVVSPVDGVSPPE
ncbi:HalOD1 output domain-containing protein [Halovivax asiaticus]|uniref:HalOD1 output domain-containing protein n=1 Tax=Halovivax asiaticus TaxID=332953 RepID=UPI001266F4EE|nr:HalOD1 output domain-containing protein [Halovivax asiaticus]